MKRLFAPKQPLVLEEGSCKSQGTVTREEKESACCGVRGKSGVSAYILQIYPCELVNIYISCSVNDIRRQRMSYAV